MTRCAICGRELTDPDSVKRGIGPVCAENLKKRIEEAKEKNHTLDTFCKGPKTKHEQGREIKVRIKEFDDLKLPCNDYDCVKGECPFANETRCPRERIYIKSDIYPLYKNKDKYCSFCGKKVSRSYRKHIHKTKITIECKECVKRNKSWRVKAKRFRKLQKIESENPIKEVSIYV